MVRLWGTSVRGSLVAACCVLGPSGCATSPPVENLTDEAGGSGGQPSGPGGSAGTAGTAAAGAGGGGAEAGGTGGQSSDGLVV